MESLDTELSHANVRSDGEANLKCAEAAVGQSKNVGVVRKECGGGEAGREGGRGGEGGGGVRW